jgi:hypothetical protein
MSNLEEISEAKIHAAVNRRLDALTPAVLAAKQEMNRRGLPKSSMTVQKVHDACVELFDHVRDDMKAEYAVLLEETLWPGDNLTSRLISRARRHFDRVAERAQSEIRDTAQGLMNSGMLDGFNRDVPLARDRALTDLSLFIDGHKRVKINRLIKAGIMFVPDLLGRLFGGKARES